MSMQEDSLKLIGQRLKGLREVLGIPPEEIAGVCQVPHGVDVRGADGTVTNYATAVKGPDIRTVLVPTHESFRERLRPEIRFRIGFEL